MLPYMTLPYPTLPYSTLLYPAAARENRFFLDVSPIALRVDAHPGSRGDKPGDSLNHKP